MSKSPDIKKHLEEKIPEIFSKFAAENNVIFDATTKELTLTKEQIENMLTDAFLTGYETSADFLDTRVNNLAKTSESLAMEVAQLQVEQQNPQFN